MWFLLFIALFFLGLILALGLVLFVLGIYKKNKPYWLLGVVFVLFSTPLFLWDFAYLYGAVFNAFFGWIDG